jgi:sugar/nucleoside kinase (ribokinase family)
VSARATELIDLAFIGALNVDHVISITVLQDDHVEQILQKYFNRNGERQTSESDIKSALEELKRYPVLQQLSGSSFIALHAARALDLNLTLACMGVEGATGANLPSFSDWLDRREINRRLVFQNKDKRAASCIALTYQGQRSLLTYPGANVDAGHFFSESYERILDFLAHCRRVHITSFFDEVSPTIISGLVSDLRELSPLTDISLDPGLRWISTRRDYVISLMGLVDTAFLNPAEFTALFGDRDVIPQIENVFCSNGCLKRIFLKQPDRTSLFAQIDRAVLVHDIPHVRLEDQMIIDDTGAGDVFAGTLLAIEQSGFRATTNATRLAVNFAKKKLGRLGQDFADFSYVMRQSLRPDGTQ